LPDERNRLGVTASRFAGDSVRRHRFRRIISEAWRLNRHGFKASGAMIVVIKTTSDESALSWEFLDLAVRVIDRASKRAGRQV